MVRVQNQSSKSSRFKDDDRILLKVPQQEIV